MGGKGPWRGRESAEPRLAPSPPASGDLGWEQRVAPHTPFSRGSESREPQDRSPPLPQSPLLGPQAARHSPRRTPQWALGVPNSAQLVGWSWSCTKQKQRGHGAAACRAEIPGRWHHRTRYMPSSQATLPAGKGRQAWPPNARPLSLPGGGPATPPRGTKLGAAGREASWPKTWYPDYRLLPGEARACPIPFHPGPASCALPLRCTWSGLVQDPDAIAPGRGGAAPGCYRGFTSPPALDPARPDPGPPPPPPALVSDCLPFLSMTGRWGAETQTRRLMM